MKKQQQTFKRIKSLSVLTVLCFSAIVGATEYYVAAGTGASDISGTGSVSKPWRTIAHAIAIIGTGSNTLHIGVGTFAETSILTIPGGLSIIGSGRGVTNITVAVPFDLTQFPGSCSGASDVSYDNYDEKFVIQIKRSSNRTIKGFSLDGINRTCHGGIYADSVTNVIFDSLDIRNFKFAGMWINYSVDCAVKNSFFKDNTFSNQANDCGELLFYSNRRLRIHNNRFENTIHGYGIKAYSVAWTNYCTWSWWTQNWNSYADSMLIYDNQIIVSETGAWTAGGNAVPCISIEFNGLSMKNVQIYNNLITNTVSLVGSYNNNGSFQTVRVHHNTFDLNHEYRYAIEANVPYLEFDHNYINGGFYPLAQWENRSAVWTDQNFHHNVFYDQQGGQVLIHYVKAPTGFKFCNNTIVDLRGIRRVFDNSSSFSGASVINNIFYRPSSITTAGTLDSAAVSGTIANNLFSNFTAMGSAAVTGDPQLVASGVKPSPYFELQSSSPAKDRGSVVAGVTGTYVGSAPDIGAYEVAAATVVQQRRAPGRVGGAMMRDNDHRYYSISGKKISPELLLGTGVYAVLINNRLRIVVAKR